MVPVYFIYWRVQYRASAGMYYHHSSISDSCNCVESLQVEQTPQMASRYIWAASIILKSVELKMCNKLLIVAILFPMLQNVSVSLPTVFMHV